MPASYLHNRAVSDEDVQRKMIEFGTQDDFEGLLARVLANPHADRVEISAALHLAFDDHRRISTYITGVQNDFLIDEILRTNYEPWLKDLIEEHWDELSKSQITYLEHAENPAVRRLAKIKHVERYFDDKRIDEKLLSVRKKEFENLKLREVGRKLSTTLDDSETCSREDAQAILLEAFKRKIYLGFYRQFGSPVVYDELIRVGQEPLQKNLVRLQWDRLSTVQQNYLLIHGTTAVKEKIIDVCADELDNDQLITIFTSYDLDLRKRLFDKAFPDDVAQELRRSRLVHYGSGEFDALEHATDEELAVLRGRNPEEGKVVAVNCPGNVDPDTLMRPGSIDATHDVIQALKKRRVIVVRDSRQV